MAEANFTSNMFEPQVFLSMVQALEPSRGLTLYNSVSKDSTIYPYVTWTQKNGRFSELAEYNQPNSKANLIDRQPGGQTPRSAALAYIREGDYFTPTATLMLKDVEAGNEAAIKPAEKIVAEQVQEVNDRVNNRIEWSLWQAVQGELTYTGKNTGTFTVDYGVRDTHKVTSSTQWDSSTAPSVEELISTIRNVQRLIRKDGGVDVNEVYLTSQTMDLLIAAWTSAAVSDANRSMLTDTQINQYYATGEIKGFMGTESWKTLDQYYDVRNEDGQTVDTKSYLPHGTILFMNRSANNALRYYNGPSADFDAPRGHIGRFSKSWTTEDPSGRQFLIEEMGLPVIDRPDQFATLKVASTTWIEKQSWV